MTQDRVIILYYRFSLEVQIIQHEILAFSEYH